MAKKTKQPVKRSGVKDAKTTIAPKPAAAAPTAEPVRSAHPPAAFRITGHVTRGDTAGSVGGLGVEAFDQDPDYEQPLGSAHTDDRGQYEINFTAERIGKGETGGPDIIVRVFDRKGAAIAVSPVHRNAAAEVTIDLAIAPKKPASLHDIAAELKLNLSPAFLAGLDKHGIRTLADVRRTGGLRNVQGLAVAPADPAVPLLEAHAQLALLPSTPAANAALLKAGYSSLAGIAGVTSRAFIASLKKTMEAGDAEALHAAATAQARFLEDRITDFRVNAGGRAETKYAALMEKAIPAGCGCETCKDATSPMAYLADLLDFALRHLKNNGNAVTLTFLQDRFHQPFRDLPATCELMEKRVRQVRICIEVLRQHLPAPQGTSTSPWYLETAYAMLLEKIGTSFDEIRQIRSVADLVKRQAVAARLGIRLHPQRALPNDPDELDRLFLDTDRQSPAHPVWPRKLSEEQLEQLFGLRDTRRPALDTDVAPDILTWRMHYLRSKWHEQDRSATPPLGETPLIDPDLVGLADLSDTTPASTPRSARPKAAWSALDFLEDRRVWIATTIGELDQARMTSGLTQLLAVLQTNVFFLGATGMEGITVPVLLRLLQKKDIGEDIAPLLAPLRLEEDAFDYMSHIVILERNGDPILDSEWSEFYSIIVARIKKYVQYAVWRDEEARNPQIPDSGITLSPDYFHVRTASFAGGALEWLPQQWRASATARHKWEDTLRARTEQEQAVITGLREAVDTTEELVLVQMRDELRIAARSVGNIHLRTPNALTGYLQIDVQAGGCQTTTRVAQAIETIQGLLFGARNGLLEDDALALDADQFDEQWQWIGSYATWRAAMQVFLYPENALRPTLRMRRSPAFDALMSNLRKVKGQVTPQAAEREAAAYADYFADVCSLRRVALCQTRSVLQGAREPADVLALAEGRSGKLYFSAWKYGPGAGLSGSPRQSDWKAAAGLENAREVVGVFPYQPRPAELRIAVYARGLVGGAQKVLSSSFDGTDFQAGPDLNEIPALLRSVEYAEGVIPVSPALAAAGTAPWTLRDGDQAAAVDIDGDGRSEIVVLAGTLDSAGMRRLGLLRELDGGLYLDWASATNDMKGWKILNEEHPLVFSSGIMMVNHSALGGGVAIGTLQWIGGNLQLTNPTQGFTTAGGNWLLDLGSASEPTLFAAADIDGSGKKLVIFEYKKAASPLDYETMTTAIVLDWNATTRSFSFNKRFEVTLGGGHTRAVRPTTVVSWFGPSGSVGQPREDIVLHSSSIQRTIAGDTNGVIVITDTFRYRLLSLRNGVNNQPGPTNQSAFYPETIPSAIPGQKPWPMGADDQFLAVPGRSFQFLQPAQQNIVIVSASRRAVGILKYSLAGKLEVAWHKEGGVEAKDASGGVWDFRAADRLFSARTTGDVEPKILVVNPELRLVGVIAVQGDASLALRWLAPGSVQVPGARGTQGWLLSPNTRYLIGDIDRDGYDEVVVLAMDSPIPKMGVLHAIPGPDPRGTQSLPLRFGPAGVTALGIGHGYAGAPLAQRRQAIANAYAANSYVDDQGILAYKPEQALYLDEAYYFVPMELALRLRESGNYTEALDWFRSIYDYDQPAGSRKTAYKLVVDAGEPVFERALDWLRDPLTPHAIAETRKNSYTKFTLLAIVRCLLDFADGEFTRATSESIPRARELYLTALELLESPEMEQLVHQCSDLIGQLVIQVGNEEEIWVWHEIRYTLTQLSSIERLTATVKQLKPLLSGGDLPTRLRKAQKITAEAVGRSRKTPTFATLADENAKALCAASTAILTDDAISDAAEHIGTSIHKIGGSESPNHLVAPDSRREATATATYALDAIKVRKQPGVYHYVPAPSLVFCIPPNPVIQAARSHAELCLQKIRACLNIAGMELRVEPYAAPTVADAGLQVLGDGDRLPSGPSRNFQPLPYRYAVLIERTKQLVELARQMENSMLSFLASADQEKYQELKARQDLALTQAGVRLKDLQLTQADDGVAGAKLQRDRAQSQVATYQGLLDAGLSTWETMALVAQHAAVTHLHTAAAITEASTLGLGGIGEVGGALAASSQVFQMHASFERRAQEWGIQKGLAEQDVRIGQQQIRLAQDQVRVVAQERAISALQVDHAEQMLDFLTTKKFTGYDLYEWMSGVIEQVYRFFLQQATSMAQAAERQLAFERQEISSAFIQADYWEPPSQGQSPDFSAPAANGQALNLRGLTGSARLLRDVYELDQHAFLKNQRKLQLTETISLAQLDPFAFEQFRQTGVLLFGTPMSLFDHKFPGHYLRLIKRVRASVIALIPPTQGIRATLSTTGTSRAVIGNDLFDDVSIQRGPEAVALSSPVNATGLFELDPQPELLVPFEGIGVDTNWEFRLPKAANQFDYGTIADVLITIEYTALDSFDYRQRVLEGLDRRVSVDRAFSFRQQFPDPWYDLHNPDQSTPPAMTVHFKTVRDDFPPNLEDETLSIRQVVLYFARVGEKPFAVPLTTSLQFMEEKTGVTVGGIVATSELALSTRRGNAVGWISMLGRSPMGDWTLTLPTDPRTRGYFDKEEIEDILFVITYSGRTPKWPL